MGIINVTPDSFSDGGRLKGPQDAIALGRRLAGEGADILDIGGESTRPGSDPVPLAEKLSASSPSFVTLANEGKRLSIDTARPR